MAVKFTVRRAGEFIMQLGGDNLCGLSGDLDFRYEFFFTTDQPDDRAFAVDHHEVDTAIQKWSKAAVYAGSCEQVALALSRIVIEVAAKTLRYPLDTTLVFKLSGSVSAGITLEGKAREFYEGLRIDQLAIVGPYVPKPAAKTAKKRSPK